MSDEPQSTPASSPPPSASPAPSARPSSTPQPAASDAPASDTPDPLAVARGEAETWRQQCLRTAADFDNFRKRTRKELEDAQRRGKEHSVRELLPVFDNLERALSMGDQSDAKGVLEGIRMVMRQFETALGRVGIERVRAVGLAFDPSQHEAVQHVDSEQYPANVVASEFQAGYRIGDYLLRAAMVAVSRGPGPAKPAEGASTTDSSDGAGEA
jgi:molecular chaperone GrpE